MVKNPLSMPVNAGDVRDAGLIPESGRSPGEGNDNPLQNSCLENPMDSGGWQATVHGLKESDSAERLTHTQPCSRLRSVYQEYLLSGFTHFTCKSTEIFAVLPRKQ